MIVLIKIGRLLKGAGKSAHINQVCLRRRKRSLARVNNLKQLKQGCKNTFLILSAVKCLNIRRAPGTQNSKRRQITIRIIELASIKPCLPRLTSNKLWSVLND